MTQHSTLRMREGRRNLPLCFVVFILWFTFNFFFQISYKPTHQKPPNHFKRITKEWMKNNKPYGTHVCWCRFGFGVKVAIIVWLTLYFHATQSSDKGWSELNRIWIIGEAIWYKCRNYIVGLLSLAWCEQVIGIKSQRIQIQTAVQLEQDLTTPYQLRTNNVSSFHEKWIMIIARREQQWQQHFSVSQLLELFYADTRILSVYVKWVNVM